MLTESALPQSDFRDGSADGVECGSVTNASEQLAALRRASGGRRAPPQIFLLDVIIAPSDQVPARVGVLGRFSADVLRSLVVDSEVLTRTFGDLEALPRAIALDGKKTARLLAIL